MSYLLEPEDLPVFKTLQNIKLTQKILEDRTVLLEKDIAWNKGIPKEEQHWYGKKHRVESKKKTSETMKKRWRENPRTLNKETKEKISNTLKGNTNTLGYKFTKEQLEKASQCQLGKKHSEETKKKIGEATRNRQLGKKRGPYKKRS